MKSETRRLKYRTRIKNRTTYKFLKRGGAAGKAPLELRPEIFAKYGIRRYYTHSLILKNFFLPKIVKDCKERAILVFFINSGHNGFILQFICNTENAIKILFNKGDLSFGIGAGIWMRKIKDSLEKEYSNINEFNDSPYIIKSEGYFIFDGVNFNCEGKNQYHHKIFTPNEAITDETYKVLPVDAAEGTPKIVEPFGGLILEYVNYSLTDIESHLNKQRGEPEAEVRFIVHRAFGFINLFYQYIKGIIDINSKGYIHTDIKIENLMFNNTGNKYTGKIVDLANIKPISTAWGFGTNSVGGHALQYHTGLRMKLERLQSQLGFLPPTVGKNRRLTAVVTPARAAEIEIVKNNILVRYDLYSLCITFFYILQTIKKTVFNFGSIEQTFASKPPKPKNLRDFEICKAAFENFDKKITEIKEKGITTQDPLEILKLPDNTTLKKFILEECLRKIDEDFENPT